MALPVFASSSPDACLRRRLSAQLCINKSLKSTARVRFQVSPEDPRDQCVQRIVTNLTPQPSDGQDVDTKKVEVVLAEMLEEKPAQEYMAMTYTNFREAFQQAYEKVGSPFLLRDNATTN